MLIVFSGLPGTGKTTVARAVAVRLGASFIRLDVIEQAMLRALPDGVEVGAAGYAVANMVAESNLALGGCVVADCVNPVEESRAAWRAAAGRASVRILEVEVICSDHAEHRRRVEERQADIPGHTVPSWEAISRLKYEPWKKPHLVIDTAFLSPDDAVELVVGVRA
ncbi:MAG: AAA family ATPase [Caulobacteraceae bacterium]